MTELHTKIDELMRQYQDDEYIMNRLRTYILNHLPSYLSTAHVTHEERNKRKQNLSVTGDKFIEEFHAENNYYYCSKQELFVKYDGLHFKQVSEDDVQHQILTTLTKKVELHAWKHKLKNIIIKMLKDTSPLSAIPDSITIQDVLKKLTPKFMLTKNSAKHFLVAAGDCIRGNKENTYIVPSGLKGLMREIESTYYNFFGISNILSNFKLKYYGHEYADTRFFHCDMRTSARFDNANMLDLLCVATHYSRRYVSADVFANTCNDKSMQDNIFFVKHLTAETLVAKFKHHALHNSSTAIVTNKNMIFILKKYFDEHNVPNIIFNDVFASEMLKTDVSYDNTSDCYIGVTSRYLPVVSSFCSFWDSHMKEDYNAPELEIDEVISLFHLSYPNFKSYTVVTPEFIIDLLKYHVSGELCIDQEKYIHNISCDLWDKKVEIEMLMHTRQQDGLPLSLYDAYSVYVSWKANAPTMSKQCFEKIARELIGETIDTKC